MRLPARVPRAVTAWSATLALVALLAVPARAAAGDLDTSFSANGWAATGFAAGDAQALGVAVQPADHKVIAVGGAMNHGTFDFALARYTRSGGQDSHFGTSGKVLDAFSPGNTLDEFAYDVALQSDGPIVVVGAVGSPAGDDFALARYKRNGTLDTTFGDHGHVRSNLGGEDAAVAVAIQDNGRIVVGGVSGQRFALARYGVGGSPDLSFGPNGTGMVTTGVGASAVAWDLAITPAGKIVLAGETRDAQGNADFAAVRYTKTGRIDRTFSQDGRVTTNFGTNADHGHGVAIVGSGKVVVAGGSDGDLALARYLADGSPDGTFGNGGRVTTNVPAGAADANALAVQGDGRLLLGGQVNTGGDLDILLARYNAGGTPDGSFATAGVGLTDLGTDRDAALDLVLDGSAKAVVAGTVASGSELRFMAARFLTT